MKKLLSVIIALFLLHSVQFAQAERDEKVEELKNIYSNLEYNTTAFNDLKQQWIINDPTFVRELFNRFVVKDALRLDGKRLTHEIINEKSKAIYSGEIIIDLRKRYYDNEIEYFAFRVPEEYNGGETKLFFDEVLDGFFLKSVVGKKIYDKLQNQEYFYNNVSKDNFDTKQGYYYDLNLNLLDMNIMFWSTTSAERNKYLVSAFGKWGNDNIFLPGWFLGDYVGGLKITYYNKLQNDLRDHTYSIAFGLGGPVRSPQPDEEPTTPIYKTGVNFYFAISGKPLEYIAPSVKNVYLDVEGSFTLQEKEADDFSSRHDGDFFNVKNYGSAWLTQKRIFNMFDFGMFEAGVGLSVHDLKSFRFDAANNELIDKFPDRGFFDNFKHYLLAKIGVDKQGGLLQHNINAIVGYNWDHKYGYWGVKSKFMISDTFGFDLRFYSAFSMDEARRPFRNTSYVVFSPVIRINY